MITNVSKVVVPVEDQQAALDFWTTIMGFRVVRDDSYGDERWIEVQPPHQDLLLVLSPRPTDQPRRTVPDRLPHSDLFFNCADIEATHAELIRRGVRFPLPPSRQQFGWWALFEDNDGTRYALGQWDDQAPSPRPETKRLGALVGRWRSDGRVVGDPAVPVSGTDTYEWLAGGFFLVHHVDVVVGGREVQALEIIGEYDPTTESFTARAFDNEGNVTVMRALVDDEGVWTFTGGADIAPAAQPTNANLGGAVRSTLTVSADRSSMTAKWERSDDGSTWQPWMDMTFTRMP
jgi:catechol 2,3-dioxygenase-like lactoylglutathione lyase family enzyme